jgi:hypothetical protein
VEHSPLFTQNSGDGVTKKKKKEEGRITWRGGDGWLDGEDDLKPAVEMVVELAVGGSCWFLFSLFFSFSLLLSVLCPFPLLFFCFCDSNCCCSRCWW